MKISVEMESGYFVSLGSNIDPENNIPRILDRILNQFHTIAVSPVAKTKPLGIVTKNQFLNVVLFVNTRIDARPLKSIFNHIEEDLGRDRSDCRKKERDRTADIDILLYCAKEIITLDKSRVPQEAYVRPIFFALAKYLGILEASDDSPPLDTVGLELKGNSFGHTSATIHYNTASRDVMVFQESTHR